MDEEWDFLSLIAADPGDDACRLVYADWLEQRGDPRAEYLRLEAALAALARQDPHGVVPQLRPRRAATEARLTELQSRLAPEWLAAVARPVRFQCSRCDLPVSQTVRRLPDDKQLGQGRDLVPAGFFWRATPGHALSLPADDGHFCLNLSDLMNTRYHPDPARLQGCCGPGGNGVNTVCVCGQEIGTECTDCCFPRHYFVLKQPYAVLMVEAGPAIPPS